MSPKGRIVVSEIYCKGCELCVGSCPQHMIALDLEHITPKGFHPAHLVGDHCTGCAVCALMCPDSAITVYRESKPPNPNSETKSA